LFRWNIGEEATEGGAPLSSCCEWRAPGGLWVPRRRRFSPAGRAAELFVAEADVGALSNQHHLALFHDCKLLGVFE
jgi:hypothetical protein